MCKNIYIYVILALLIHTGPHSTIYAQTYHQHSHQLVMIRTEEAIEIDGIEEKSWESAREVGNFVNHRPTGGVRAESQTVVKMLYSDAFIYVLVRAYHLSQDDVIQNLKRDNFFNNDGFGLVIDPINKQANGFFFGVSSKGSHSECLVASSGSKDWNWDAKWYSKVRRYGSYWIAELAIPFYSLQYDPQIKNWGINFVRSDMSNNMYSTWTDFPTNFDELDLGHTGMLSWESDIPDVKKKAVVIPSLTATVGQNFEEESSGSLEVTPSLDAKYAVTSSLNLDLTINPDFSQVEVDRQVINLSRFNLFFPEKRTFFLENSDLFSSFGRFRVRPFFSRRIGLVDGEITPIIFGARLTGNLAQKLRIGILNVQTAQSQEFDSQNYGILAFQQRVLKRSSVSGIFVNRQNTSGASDYNRVAGAEFNYLSEKGTISADAMYYKSFANEVHGANDFFSSSIFVNARSYRLFFQSDLVGENFLNDVGFSPRLFHYDATRDTVIRMNYQEYNLFAAWDFRPDEGWVVFHGPRIQNRLFTNDGDQFNEWLGSVIYEIDFADQSQFDGGFNFFSVNLLFPITFLNGGEPLNPQQYDYSEFFLDWDSDPRKLFGYGTVFTSGSFYSGSRTGIRSFIQYRFQPWLRMRLDHNFNKIDLGNLGKEHIHLLGLRTELSFSTSMFWTSFFQYNTQALNININSRFQWRFAPMSDLFIVYTDNYYSDSFTPKNRYLSVKINYWLNL